MKMKLTGPGTAYDHLRSTSEALSKAREERQAKRLSEMQDAIKRLQAMPSPKQIAKQDSMNRVAMLKKRLDTLKAMLLHASPEQARSLARELKNIAKELASVAKSLGSGGSTQGAVSPSQNGGETAASGSASSDAQSAVNATTDSAAADEATNGASESATNNVTQAVTNADVATSSTTSQAGVRQENGDGDLRAMLQDAKKLLKEVIGMLKAKMALAANNAKANQEERQAKLNLESAEKSLADMDKALSQGYSEIYSALGNLGTSGMGDGIDVSISISGSIVNISA